MRQIVEVPCEGESLLATLDGPADATIGWLIATGGSQTRVGPHRLYERLARRLAEAGHAVVRIDRRGVGDSSGTDRGYLDSEPDLRAAMTTLKANFPFLHQYLGFGLCDGSTALALFGDGLGLTDFVLANPWVVEPTGDLPPAAAIRGHYAKRLADPRAWIKLLSGGVNLRRLARGIAHSAARADGTLARRFGDGLKGEALVVLAEGDGTAQSFAAAWRALDGKPIVTTLRIATASHSFADPAAFEALVAAMLSAVTRRR
jgi:exosortase A-associated hydrolase 1